MPATCKTDLLNVTLREFAKLTDILDRVPVAAQLAPDPEAEGTTLKDIIGHRAHWIALFLGWYAEGQKGKQPDLPAPGYKWNELKRFNADLRLAQVDLTWDDARALLERNHQALLSLLNNLDDTALYAVPMPGGNNKWTTGRWAEAAGPSHYRSASKYIRARLKALDL